VALFSHIPETDLALHAGGDLPRAEALAAKLHLMGCPYCRARLERFAVMRSRLAEEAAMLPAGLDWDGLSAEMAANIHLGLTAGELVRRTPRVVSPQRENGVWGWRLGAVCASLSVVVLAVWTMSGPSRGGAPPVDRAVLELPSGAALKTVDFDGGESARQLDSETGQMTITQVYAD
jgi:anti-sigma factor RsiW